MSRLTRGTTPLLLLTLALPTAARPQAVTRRDSAGIRIVETKAPVWGSAARWTVDPKPVVTIGEAEGADPYLFQRIMGVVRRKDGSFIIADYASRQLRTFDASGKFIAAKGRKGQGPAEFGSIDRFIRCGSDEIWVDAGSGRRISVWSLQLEYRREFVMPEHRAMWPMVCFGGSGFLVFTETPFEENHATNAIYPDSLTLFIADSVGKNPHILRKILLYDRIAVKKDRGIIDFPHPFYPTTVMGAAGRDFMMTTGDRLEVLTYSRDGKLTRITRAPAEDLTVTPAVLRVYQAAILDSREKQWRDLLDIAGKPMPKTLPALTQLLTDPDGNTWAKRFTIPGDSTSRWGIFGKDGQFLGHMLLPKGLKVFEIGPDYVLGTVQDSLQVEKVRMYRLRR